MKKIAAFLALIIFTTSSPGVESYSCKNEFDSFCKGLGDFENFEKDTEDGFGYYTRYDYEGLCITTIPDTEEVVIPEFINGEKVVRLGMPYMPTIPEGKRLESETLKKLTIQHTVYYGDAYLPNVETLVYVDIAYCKMHSEHNTIISTSQYLDGHDFFSNLKTIELTSRFDENLEVSQAKILHLSEFVKKIDADTFKYSDLTIRTSWKSAPEGWEEGWNGDNPVIWGVDKYGNPIENE